MDFLMSGNITPRYTKKNCILFNCNCLRALDSMYDESIDLFCSDIPYKISTKGGGQKKDRKKICWRNV